LSSLQSNRDLYLSIESITREYRSIDRSLEEYLRAMLQLAKRFADRSSLALDEFHMLIYESFTAQPIEFDEDWRNSYDRLPINRSDFDGWRSILIQQIIDLREMRENGTLADANRYFGIDSPRNSRWYNFDPLGYLECAMAGSFGGWEPDDESGRELVPGRVSVIAEDGSIQDLHPQDLPYPQFEMPAITWDELKDFMALLVLWCKMCKAIQKTK
jgi:hypothetical protein